MTADLLLSQVISQTHSPGIERGKMGVSVQDLSAVTNTPDESAEKDGESFLNTLKQIAKDFNSTQQLLGTGEVKSSETHTFDSADNLDAIAHPADALETGVSETTTPSVNDMDDAAVQEPHALIFLEIINTLEELGILDSMGGSSLPNKAAEILGDEEGIVTLKMLIPRLGQNDFVPSAEMKAALDRLQQFIVNAQTGNASSHNGGKLSGQITDSRSKESADLNQSAENSQAASRSEKGDMSDSIKLAMAARLVGAEASENAKELRPLETVRTDVSRLEDGSDTPGKTGAPSQASFINRISSTVDIGKLFGGDLAQQTLSKNEFSPVIQLTSDVQTAKALSQDQRYAGETVQDNPVNNESATVIKLTSETQTIKALSQDQRYAGETVQDNSVNNESATVIKLTSETQTTKALSQDQRYAGETVQDNSENNESAPVIKLTSKAQTAKALSQDQRYAGGTVRDNPVNNESSSVIKMINDAQMAKENHLKMDAAMNDELGGKITKVDAGANDNGLLSSQIQTAEKTFDAISPFRQLDTGQDRLRTQTLGQIVQKTVIYMRNGQHEAKIDLKPEFLGHVRMQVTTENHQVTVKILTESGFVKDMVENNIHQLKTDLQQQGLKVDKLEVAVFSDFDENKHSEEKAGQAKGRRHGVAGINLTKQEGETWEQTGNTGLGSAGLTTVDYFA